MDKMKQALEGLGIPSRDSYDLPDSNFTFGDGGHYRMEVAGIERLSALETMVSEAEKHKVPIHRIIATVGGSTYLTKTELIDFSKLAAQEKIEVIMTIGPRRFWDTGRQIVTSEGLVSGMRIRGCDNLYYFLKDLERCLDAGFRGFLVADEGMLLVLSQLRENGTIPKETIFKVSVFAGHGNPAGARLLEQMGANSFNPLADLSLPMLAAIRKVVRIPLDVYMVLVSAMGGFNRFYEAADIIRVASPCYLKFEPGESEDAIYQPTNPESYHINMVQHKVSQVSIVKELIESMNPQLKASPAKSSDLVIPKPYYTNEVK